MNTVINKAIVRRIFDDLINGEDKTVIDQIFHPQVVVHDPFVGTATGADAFRQLLGMFDAAFPHHRVTVEQMVAENDNVTVLHTHYATHNGPFMGLAATGTELVVHGVEMYRLRDGKIVEFWRHDDDVALLMQLGLIRLPAAA